MSYNSPFSGNTIQPTDVSYRAIALSANVQLEWPINGTTTGDTAARIMEVTPTAAGFEIYMPPANQASVGQDALFRNLGADSFTVTDYASGNVIVVVAAGESKYIYITDNADEEGTWGIISFGVGSSSADAATLAGYGMTVIGLTLNQSMPVNTFSNDESAVAADRGELRVWTGGAGTLTLDAATTLGNNWFTIVRNGGTGLLTVDCTGGDLINGASSIGMQAGDSCIIGCSGTAFYTVGLGRNTQFNFSLLVKTVSAAGSPYTLTAEEASNTIQKYISIGALTGNVEVRVPPSAQIYFMQNATDGGAGPYTITFTTNVSGGSDAVVTAGNQATLLCDSVNMLNANTVLAGSSTVSLLDGTVGSPSLNFGTETNTGIYRPGAGEFALSILGTKRFGLTATGLTITGTGTFSGGVSGGTFP